MLFSACDLRSVCLLVFFGVVQGHVLPAAHHAGGVLWVVGADDGRNPVADVVLVPVGGIHEAVQLGEEDLDVEGDGLADVDELVLGLLQAHFGHQLLLIELLARAQPGVDHLDVLIRFEAGEADEVAGQGVDLHGGSHVEDEDLAAVGVGAGEEDEAHGLGDRHEVADDIRVRDRDGAALGDLLLEQGDDGAVGAEDVAEAHGDKLGVDVLPVQRLIVPFAGGLVAQVGEELGDLIGFARLDLGIEGLDDHLAKALGGAHDVGGVHGLVRRDEDKTLTAVGHGGVGGLVGADGVVLDGLAGAALHEGHMLVRRCVVDDLRPVGLADLEHAAAVPDGADEGDEVQVRVRVLQLVLDVVGVVLVDIEDDELLRAVGRDLAAELRTDGAAAPGDEDGLAVNEVEDFLQVGGDGLAPQQVLNRDVLHLADGDVPEDELVHAGQVLQLAAGLLADIQDVPALLGRGAGDGEEDLLHRVLLGVLQDGVPAADDGHAVNVSAPFVGVVVDDTDDLLFGLVGGADVAEDHLAGVARADEHHAGDVAPLAAGLAQEEDEAVGKAHAHHEDKLDHAADDIVGNGHAAEDERDEDAVEDARDDGGQDDAPELREAGKAPEALIQPQRHKDDHAEDRVDRDEVVPGLEINPGNSADNAVEAEPEGQEIGEIDDKEVIGHEQGGDDLPVLEAAYFLLRLILIRHGGVLT